jgi:spore coat-associated protein N
MPVRLAPAFALLLLALVSADSLAGANGRDQLTHAGLVRGGLRLTSSKRGAILSGRRLAPGARRSGSVTITNTGTLAGSFTLSNVVHGNKRLARQLRLTVRERKRGRKRVVYSGTLAGLHAVSLGVIKAAHARTFEFSVSFRATVPNALQGRRTSADFTWTAVHRS